MSPAANKVEETIFRRVKAVQGLVRQLQALQRRLAAVERTALPVLGEDDLLSYALSLVEGAFGALAVGMAKGEGHEREIALRALQEQYDGNYY